MKKRKTTKNLKRPIRNQEAQSLKKRKTKKNLKRPIKKVFNFVLLFCIV